MVGFGKVDGVDGCGRKDGAEEDEENAREIVLLAAESGWDTGRDEYMDGPMY